MPGGHEPHSGGHILSWVWFLKFLTRNLLQTHREAAYYQKSGCCNFENTAFAPLNSVLLHVAVRNVLLDVAVCDAGEEKAT